jgi:hypothetical protein
MATTYIEIGGVSDGSYRLLARCIWREGEQVKIEGVDRALLTRLAGVLPGPDAVPVTHNDGLAFLRAVQQGFNHYPLSVSELIEGEPPARA